MARRLLAVVLLMALLGGVISGPARAAEITVDQVNLRGTYQYSASPWEINPDSLGNLIVSDSGGVIWKINPLSGAYTLYDTAIPNLSDAHPVSGGYWFTDYLNGVAFTDLTDSYYWIFQEVGMDPSDYSFGALELDPAGNVWIVEYFGASSRLYKANKNNENTATICPLVKAVGDPYYGTYAYDMVEYGGFLWFYNYFTDRIVKFNPVADGNQEYTLEHWATEVEGEIEGRTIEFDANGNLWISGGGAGTILRFNPATKDLDTYSAPLRDYFPGGDLEVPSIEGVTVVGNRIWYADLWGSVGELDPAASHTSTNLTTNTNSIKLKLSSTCAPLTAIKTGNYPSQSGTLPFVNQPVTLDTTTPGWAVYVLTTSDVLSGINNAQGVVLVSEPNESSPQLSKLLRFKPSTAPEFKVFLPLIIR